MKSGQKRFPLWDDYASPELLDYIDFSDSTSATNFAGDVSSDLFSWATIAWELLVGELPFTDTEAKLKGRRNLWPDNLTLQLQVEADLLFPNAIRLIEECLDRSPAKRPNLALLRRYFP